MPALHESVVIPDCILCSHDKGGKSFITIAEAVRLIARNKNIATSSFCLARFPLANGKKLQKAVIAQEDADILGAKWMSANRRDDKAKSLQA